MLEHIVIFDGFHTQYYVLNELVCLVHNDIHEVVLHSNSAWSTWLTLNSPSIFSLSMKKLKTMKIHSKISNVNRFYLSIVILLTS